MVRPLVPFWVCFLLYRNSLYRFWGVILCPVPQSLRVSVELFDVGGWLTRGDFALEAGVDYLAVVEHRLIPARVG